MTIGDDKFLKAFGDHFKNIRKEEKVKTDEKTILVAFISNITNPGA